MPKEPSAPLSHLEFELAEIIGGRLLGCPDRLGPENDLYAAGLDSMGIMQLLVLVEEQYGIAIPDTDLTRENFGTIRALAGIIRGRSVQAA